MIQRVRKDPGDLLPLLASKMDIAGEPFKKQGGSVASIRYRRACPASDAHRLF